MWITAFSLRTMFCNKEFGSIKSWILRQLNLDMDFKTLFEKNSELLGILGLNFQKKGFKSWPNLLKFFLAIIPLIVGNILNVRTMWMEEMELRQTIINACHIVGTFMALHRVFHIFIDAEKLNELIDWANQSTTIIIISKDWEENTTRKYARYCRIMSLTLSCVYWILTVANAYVPIFFQEWFMLCQLAIPGLDVRSHPGYEVALFVNICLVYYMVKMLDVYDAYFYFYTLYIVMRLKICCYMASKIGDFSSEFDTPYKQTKLLLKLSKTHEDVKRFTAEFSKSFVILMLGEGMTAMALLTLALLINELDPLYSLAVVVITTNQFFLLCFFGDLILHNGNELSKEIYSSQWYNIHNKQDRLTIAFLLQNTQKKSKFSAYGMYELSLETFSNFVKNAYSFYALIRNMA